MELADLQIYHNGKYVRYGDAKIGLLAHGLNYGTGCFEGIRGYWNADQQQVNIFRLQDHFERLRRSAKLLLISLEETTAQLSAHAVELVRRNELRKDVYIRPIVFKSAEEIGVRLHGVGHDISIVALPHKAYLDASKGLRTCISSWRRVDDNSAPARAKLTGIYVSSALAKTDAVKSGFDEAILLTADGHVAEGSAENIFIVRDRVLITPPVTDNILEGITRAAVMELAQTELGLSVVERSIDRSELYQADEVFFTGTAVGVSAVVEVDHRPIGDGAIGKVSAALIQLYDDITLGRLSQYARWLTPCFPLVKTPGIKAPKATAP
ncbi:MAG: branched-chain amino acid transaminase [Candidatus Eremiobacteraeota bacterium]|nr:branched-chain amino acid transaminase [Candidatus Eremiobacteraeota bacterium]